LVLISPEMTITTGNKLLYNHRVWYYIIMMFFAALYFATAISNHYLFRTGAFDYGLYNFAFYDYAHFHISKCPIYYSQNMSLLQDHFSLTLMYYVPVYWLLNWLTGSYTLLLIQVSMLLVGAWATCRLVILKTGDNWLGTGALLYYFLLQGHFSVFAGDCNIGVISAAFIPLFIYYFELKKYLVATVFFVLALFSKENFPLWFAGILPVIMLWHRKDKKVVSVCLLYIFAAILYFLLLFKVIIPHLETADKHYDLFNYSALGANPFEALKFVLHHPVNTFKMFFVNQLGDAQYDGIKKEFYLVYFISGGFLLFLRPQYFIWFIPVLAQKMMNDEPGRWSIEWHYGIEVVTMLPIAVFIIISSFRNTKIKYLISGIVCLLTLLVTGYKMKDENRTIQFSGTLKEDIFNPDFFKTPYNPAKINEALSLIPANARVSASSSILPHLASRNTVYAFPKVADAQYIAAFSFFQYTEPGLTENLYSQQFYQCVLDTTWTITANEYPFLLLEKKPRKSMPNRFDSVTCNNQTMDAAKKHLIASNGSLVYGCGVRDSSRVRHGKYSCMLTDENKYGMQVCDSAYTPGNIVCVSIWCYSQGDNGALVVSCGKSLYQASNVSVAKDSLGWHQIRIYATVPFDRKKFCAYAWNTGGPPVWFDDVKIVRCKERLLQE